MRHSIAKYSFYAAANLLLFAMVGTAVLAYTYNLTHEAIAQSELNEKLKLVVQVAPSSAYDNDIMQNTVQLAPDALLGSGEATTAYIGRLKGEPSIAVLQAFAPDGYSGKINLIIAIYRDGKIGGVRVVSHKETPGLGDYIEIAKSKWITQFDGLTLEKPKDSNWKVKKDGGAFEHTAGATITPRAVVKAVHKALQYAAQHRNELFIPAPSPEKASPKEAEK